MIKRILSTKILETAKVSPLIGIVGPRQSGKTTLAKEVFSKYTYVNLEQPDVRLYAQNDPKAFLSQYDNHVILDEIQRVPELFSYLQVKVDNDKKMGQYILTGSQHFLMMQSITQSLAGRIAIFNLYPLSYEELQNAKKQKDDIFTQIWYGGYPRLYEQEISPLIWLNNYIQTYIDRDVSLISQITNLKTFETFLRVIAGRTGQLLNLSSLSNELGISHNTVKAWINLLETSGIVYLLQPFYSNISKRLIKAPKIYFTDTGLVCRLLGIESPTQLNTHPLYGSIFETHIVIEYLKYHLNRGISPNIYFWRDKKGLEADLYKNVPGSKTEIFEIKSSQTIPEDAFGKLKQIQSTTNNNSQLNVIYGGDENQSRTAGKIISWSSLPKFLSK
jgi:predicted AAA+ superfamily ATPase